MHYSAINKDGNFEVISTLKTPDRIERIVSIATAYTSAHGRSAPVGTVVEYAIKGMDEYEPTIAQIWVDTLEEAPEFNPDDYPAITEGLYNPLTMPGYPE